MENIQKKPYEKPEIKVIDIDWETSLLVASDPQPKTGKELPFN